MPDISVSIVSYNTCALLRACLQSLQARDREGEASLEILVADNGSTDGSLDMVAAEFPQVILIRTGGNLGYGRANNLALAQARGRFFLVLNSDTEVEPGALRALCGFLDSHPEAGLAAPRLILPDGTTQPSCFAPPSLASVLWEQTYLNKLLPRSRVFGGFEMTYWDYNEPRSVAEVSGACFLIRAALYRDLGGFDPHYFMYFEDIDLCVRLRQTGQKIWFLPQARVRHCLGESSRQDWQARARMIAAYNASRCYYFSRFEGPRHGRLLKALVLLGTALRLSAWSLLALVRPGARRQVRLFGEVWRQTWRMAPQGSEPCAKL